MCVDSFSAARADPMDESYSFSCHELIQTAAEGSSLFTPAARRKSAKGSEPFGGSESMCPSTPITSFSRQSERDSELGN